MSDDSALTRVEAALVAAGLFDRITEFTTDVPTAAAAAEQLGCEVGAIANSLVFRAGDEPVLVLASGAHRVDVAKAAEHLGVPKLSRADPDFVHGATGQRVGGCAPVGHPTALRTLVDRDLARYDRVWAGAGIVHAMFWTTHDELVTLTGAPSVDVGRD
ncbi:YbaK/EbsC family protein [Mobilicoccus massiliensis]|uniref:YbaK/EbsC family protein n=1 Tax=Mobilicoccus massiliensis TaxID=1522310 RepID=UPI0005900821|nr:YbaK/EbsC family protein [Mobilicoccus massiliensis]